VTLRLFRPRIYQSTPLSSKTNTECQALNEVSNNHTSPRSSLNDLIPSKGTLFSRSTAFLYMLALGHMNLRSRPYRTRHFTNPLFPTVCWMKSKPNLTPILMDNLTTDSIRTHLLSSPEIWVIQDPYNHPMLSKPCTGRGSSQLRTDGQLKATNALRSTGESMACLLGSLSDLGPEAALNELDVRLKDVSQTPRDWTWERMTCPVDPTG